MSVLIRGSGASPGVFRGKVAVALSANEAREKTSKRQDHVVLVVPMTDPEWTLAMASAGAIVTNSGGILCHAAIVAREFKIPCVVGTRVGTEVLKDDMSVVVDGTRGLVYREDEA